MYLIFLSKTMNSLITWTSWKKKIEAEKHRHLSARSIIIHFVSIFNKNSSRIKLLEWNKFISSRFLRLNLIEKCYVSPTHINLFHWLEFLTLKGNGPMKIFWSSNHITIISNDKIQDNWLLFNHSACDFIVIVKAASNWLSRIYLWIQLVNWK